MQMPPDRSDHITLGVKETRPTSECVAVVMISSATEHPEMRLRIARKRVGGIDVSGETAFKVKCVRMCVYIELLPIVVGKTLV